MLWLIHVPDPPRLCWGLAAGHWYALVSELDARPRFELRALARPPGLEWLRLYERLLPGVARAA